MTPDPPVRVHLVCTGLGHERRGFEAFTRACAAALAAEPAVQVEVFAGGRDGAVAGERVVANLPRASRRARWLGGLLRRDSYFIEQGSFFLGYLPTLVRRPPDVLYFADLNFGNVCWHWRRRTGARFRMLFNNSGPTTMPFTRTDHVQQVTPAALEAAIARGESAERQTLLPFGIALPPAFVPTDAAEKRRARQVLQLPVDGEVVLCVAKLDRSYKRVDLLIEAVAALPEPRPFLLLVGADGPDGAGLRQLARARCGDRWAWRSLASDAMGDAYAAADRFALLSHNEGFGLAYLEALAAGLPVVANDDPTTRYVIGDAGTLRAIADVATAREALEALRGLPTDPRAARARYESVRARFSWEALRPAYVALLRHVAAAA